MNLLCTYVNFIFQVWEYIFEDFSIFGFYQYCIEVLVTYFHIITFILYIYLS